MFYILQLIGHNDFMTFKKSKTHNQITQVVIDSKDDKNLKAFRCLSEVILFSLKQFKHI